MARNPGILFRKPSLIRSPQYYRHFFWLIGDRINGVPLYFNHSNGSFHVRREHVFLFVCLFFSQPHIIAQKIIWYFIGVQYKVLFYLWHNQPLLLNDVQCNSLERRSVPTSIQHNVLC